MQPPVFDIDPAAFATDPYPVYRRMHETAPICFVPQLGAVLLTRRDDIFTCEKNIAVFSSHQPAGLMTRLMGENMMRKDGEPHLTERRQIFETISPRTAMRVWRERFEAIATRLLDELEPRGEAEIVRDYAMPLSGEALALVTGLGGVHWSDIDAWSQAMIDGIANYQGVAETEQRCIAATAAIDAAVDEALAEGDAQGSGMIAVARRNGMPAQQIRNNVKLAISGGQNEPRDAIGGCVHALLAHPEALAAIEADKATWQQAFEEYGRWVSPIGMSPRRIAQAHEHAGVAFEPEQRAFLMFAAANRDPAVFNEPERFDITRDTSKAIVFGAGPHFCAGAHVSRTLVAEVALPAIFGRLRNLRLAGEVDYRGWAFRGPKSVPVAWEPR